MRLYELMPISGIKKKIGSADYPMAEAHKVYSSDDCYKQFLKYCFANTGNPHLPKFRGKSFNIYKGEYTQVNAIRMEKLELLQPNEDGYFIGISIDYVRDLENNSNADSDMTEFHEKYPELVATFIELSQIRDSDCSPDMHQNNMMARSDGTYVIIDPWIG